MAKKRSTPARKPEGKVYDYEGQKLQLVKTKSMGCDGCIFDFSGRCMVGDEEEMLSMYDCTINAGDEIFVKVTR